MLPEDPKARKRVPLATGLIDYFPDALAAVAQLSLVANEQHNPGEPLHWAREKSADHDDCLLRHFLDRGTIDSDGIRHSAKVAWRALALLQLEIERVTESRRQVLPIATAEIGAYFGGPEGARIGACIGSAAGAAYDAHPGVELDLTMSGALSGRAGPIAHNPVSQATGDL
jgi:hypothetical protein